MIQKRRYLSFKSDILPEPWKAANVKPAIKKGLENWTIAAQVCLMSVLGKLEENITPDHIAKPTEEQVLLKENQPGFCQGKFCLIDPPESVGKKSRGKKQNSPWKKTGGFAKPHCKSEQTSKQTMPSRPHLSFMIPGGSPCL